MGFVVTLRGVTPPPRDDGEPFTQLRLEEATSETGPWTPIITTTLAPVDTDPTKPLSRNITTDNATLENGYYRAVFIDADGDIAPSAPVYRDSMASGLVSVEDVRKVLNLRNPALANDHDLQEAIEAAISWLRPKMLAWDASGGTDVFFNVRPNEVLPVPIPEAEVTAIRAYTLPESAAVAFASPQHYFVGNGVIRLTGQGWGWDPRVYAPGDYVGQGYSRVEVDWQNTQQVPAALRMGIALFAAGLFNTNTKLTSGMRSESIGGYSYTLSDKDVEHVMPPRAKALLKPFMKKRRVLTTP